MKNALWLCLLLIALGSAAFAQGEQINWEKDFKKAQAAARETGRPMLLDFTAVWCKPCKMMDEQFWVLPEVAQAVKPFIAVKIDYDNRKDLVGKYGVAAIPFVVFTDPLGNPVTFRRGFGSKNARELNMIFNEMPKDFSALLKDYAAVEANKNDGTAWLRIAEFYTKSRLLYLGSEFYKKALKTDEFKADAEKREHIASMISANFYGSRAYDKAVDWITDYLKDYPSGKNRETLTAMLAISYANLGKEKDALKQLDALRRDFPASKNIEAVSQAIEKAKTRTEKK